MEEIKRVLFTRRRVLILVILVLYSIFHFCKPLLNDNAFDTRDGWASYLENYRGVPLEDIKSDLNTITKGGKDYMALDVYGRMFQNQVDYLLDYPSFLENVQWQAGTMLGVSIFMTNDGTVLKTAEDYKRMEGVELTIGMDNAVTHAFWRTPSDWLLAAYMVIVVLSFMAERKRGMWELVCASAGGRVRLPLARLVCVLLAAFMGAVLFTAVEVCSGWLIYGGFHELDRMVQSIAEFKGFTIPMTIGQFWLFYGMLRFVGAFVVGMVLWLFFEAIPDRRLAAIAFALFAGVEYVLFTIFPGDSMLDTVNLFMCISPRNMLLSYEVLTPFGLSLGRIDVYLVFGAIAAVTGIAVVMVCCRVRKPNGGLAWVTRLTDFWRRHTAAVGFHGRLFFHELYKMLVTGRGAVVFLAALLIAYSISQSPYLGNDGRVSQALETYYRQSQGPLTAESETYLQEQREKLADMKEDYAGIQRRYENGYLSDIEYRAMSLQYKDLGEKEAALDQYEQDIQTLSAFQDPYIMPHWVYAELFGVQSNTVGTLQTVSLLAVSLMCVLYASTEGSTGMTKARRATPRGRSQALIARYGAGVAISAVVSILIWVVQILMLSESYGSLPFLEAPICCLHYFRDIPQSVSIIGYWALLTAGRTALLCVWSVVLLWATDRLQK